MPDSKFKEKEDIQLLLQCCQQLGLDASTIQPENPHSHGGKVATAICAAASALDPIRAAQWAQDAGKSASLASVGAMMGLSEMTPDIHADLLRCDPQYVADVQAQQRLSEEAALKKMGEEADALHRQNYVAMYGSRKAEIMLAREKEAEQHAAAQQQQQGA